MFATVTFANGKRGHFEGDDLAECVESAVGALFDEAAQFDPFDNEKAAEGDHEMPDGTLVTWTAVAIENPCEQCGAPTIAHERYGRTRGEEQEYFIDVECTECGHVVIDTEGGI